MFPSGVPGSHRASSLFSDGSSAMGYVAECAASSYGYSICSATNTTQTSAANTATSGTSYGSSPWIKQQIQPGSREALVLCNELTYWLRKFENKRITIDLPLMRTMRVEVYMAGHRACFGIGWPLVYELMCLAPGDVAFFKEAAEGTYTARFFSSSGFARGPAELNALTSLGVDNHPAVADNCTLGLGVEWSPYLFLEVNHIRTLIRFSVPIYLCRMTQTTATRSVMYFNREFTEANFQQTNTNVLIKVEGTKQACMGKVVIGFDRVARISSGWWIVTSGLKLQEGDVCCVEYDKTLHPAIISVRLISRGDRF